MTRTRPTTAARVAAVVVGVLVALPLALVALLATAAPAEASSYRYWTYWWGSGTGKSGTGWTFAKVGPAGHRVNDTWVLGWRFATSASTTTAAKPRQSADFTTLCPSLTDAVEGKDRVALVVDYGTTSDAPPGQRPPSTSTVRVECLTLPSSPHATGIAVLNAAGVSIRSQDGLICALDGYPKGECAPVIADPSPTPTATRPRTTPSARSSSSSTPRASTSTSVGTASSSRPLATTGASSSRSGTPAAIAPPSPSSSTGAAAAGDTSAPGDPTSSFLPAVAGAPASAQQQPGSPLGVVVGVLVIAAVAGSAWWTSRRRGTR